MDLFYNNPDPKEESIGTVATESMYFDVNAPAGFVFLL